MTKEQEKAIEFLEFYKKHCLRQELANLEDYETVNDEDFVSYNIETVLNMLKEKDKEIEHQKEKRENQKTELAILNKKQKEMNKLINTVKSYKGMFKKLQKEIEKKDRINKALIDFIYEMSMKRPGTIMYDLREDGFDTSECGKCKDRTCRECIKQYFERKSEE